MCERSGAFYSRGTGTHRNLPRVRRELAVSRDSPTKTFAEGFGADAKGPVAIPAGLRSEIEKWREMCPNAAPNAFIFPNSEGNAMDPSNFIDRVIRPAAVRAKISVSATFQVMRRTTATKQQAHGGPKSVQGQLRHSTVQTTFEFYAQKIDSDQQAMVDSDWAEVQKLRKRKKRSPGNLTWKGLAKVGAQIGAQRAGNGVPKGL